MKNNDRNEKIANKLDKIANVHIAIVVFFIILLVLIWLFS